MSLTSHEGVSTILVDDDGRDDPNMPIILINLRHDSVSRLMELIVHESSHFLDKMFEDCQAKPCTEVRAYYHDWIVGKLVARFKL